MTRTLALLLVMGLGSPVFAQSAPASAPPASKPSEPAPARTPAPTTDAKKDEAKKVDADVLGFKMKSIDDKEVDLAQYKGKVILIVNVASKCGNTPQYKGLEELYNSKKDKGLVILAFPANNFGGQEPGTNAEIKAFCTDNYHVSFPIFAKISVKGEDVHPLYKKLAAQPAPVGGEPKWNFHKFLVDRNGKVVARFEHKVAPDDKKLVEKIDELLAAKTDAKPAGEEKKAPEPAKKGG